MKLRPVKSVPHPSAFATAIAIIADESKMLVCENVEKTLELPGLVIASKMKALQSLEALIEELDVADQPQQTLYLSNFTMDETQKKPVTVIVRIVQMEKAEVPSSLGGQFLSLTKLRMQQQASPLVRTVAHWMSD